MAEVKTNDPVANQLREKYPSNSKISQPAPKQEKVKPVVQGKASLQQETLGMKIKKMLFPSDIRDIKEHAINNIIIPNLKNGAVALVELALFGKVRGRSGGYYGGNTNYTYISSNKPQTAAQAQASISRTDRATHNFQNIIFESYQDAERVIDIMMDLVDRYGRATVAQFYDAADIDSDWASENWGWTSFQRLECKAVRGGYIIDVNPPTLLK